MAKQEAAPTKAGSKEIFKKAASAAAARGDTASASAWYELAGESLAVSESIRDKDAKQNEKINQRTQDALKRG